MANPTTNPIVQFTELPGRGRAIVATRDIKAGEILLTDSPILLYPADPFSRHYCTNCFKHLNPSSPFTCPSCPNLAPFCSPACQSAALASSHSPWVCQALTSIHQSFSTSLDVDDVSDAHFLISAYNLGAASPDSFKLLLSLEGAVAAPDPRTLAIHSLVSALSPPQAVIGLGFSLELSAALLAKDKRNGFALMEPFGEGGERNARAYGIFPNASFFNHDCLPNAARFDYVDGSGSGSAGGRNTDMIVRAIHDFPRGREVCLSYFPVNWSYADRQKRLKEDYGFVCDCDRCKVEVNWKDDNDNENDNDNDNDDSMEETEDEQMMGSDEENGEGENDFPHAYFFVKYVCDRDGCGGTLAPLPPSQGASADVMECNVCGKLRSGEEADGIEGEDGTMEDD